MISVDNDFQRNKIICISYNDVEKLFLCNLKKSTCHIGPTLIMRLKNGLKGKKIVYFSLLKNVGGFLRRVKN